MNVLPVVLAGRLVRLEPLGPEHAQDLLVAAQHNEIWTYLDEPTPREARDIERFIQNAYEDQVQGTRLAFAVVDQLADVAIGSTSYIDIRPSDRGLEIGWTWLTPSRWGSGINAEAKYLLLRHAFDALGAVRVALKTDARNLRSQHAIVALGATREGVWRNHRILSNGKFRDTVYYSIIESEWPDVQSALTARLANMVGAGES